MRKQEGRPIIRNAVAKSGSQMRQPNTVTICRRLTPKDGYQSAQTEGKTHHSQRARRTRKLSAETKTVTSDKGSNRMMGTNLRKQKGRSFINHAAAKTRSVTIQGSQMPEACREGWVLICTHRREDPTFVMLQPGEKVRRRPGIAGTSPVSYTHLTLPTIYSV